MGPGRGPDFFTYAKGAQKSIDNLLSQIVEQNEGVASKEGYCMGTKFLGGLRGSQVFCMQMGPADDLLSQTKARPPLPVKMIEKTGNQSHYIMSS